MAAPSSSSSASRQQPPEQQQRVVLGIQFDASTEDAASTSDRVSWREGRLANWTVVLGEKRFKLHKFILAKASTFFEGALCEAYGGGKKDETDLTRVLPERVWPFFPDLLDAIYGEEPPRQKHAGSSSGGAVPGGADESGGEANATRGTTRSAGTSAAAGEKEETEAEEDEEVLRLASPLPEQREGVLTLRSAVPLLVAADVLGVKQVFRAAVGYLERRMLDSRCCLYLWKACLHSAEPLSTAVGKVASAARERVLPAFERFRVTEKQALLRLPYDAMLGLLREDALCVSGEALLADFVIEYGRANGLLPEAPVGMGALLPAGCERDSQEGKRLYREANLDFRRREIASWPTEPNAKKNWRALCAGLRWAQMEGTIFHVSDLNAFQAATNSEALGSEPDDDPNMLNWRMSSVILPRHHRPFDGRNSPRPFPVEFALAASLYNTATRGPWWRQRERAEKEWADQEDSKEVSPEARPVSRELIMRARMLPRPPDAVPCRPHQVEKFFYFAGAEEGLDFAKGAHIVSEEAVSGALPFRLKVYPLGDLAAVVPEGGWVISAFVEVLPRASWPDVWEFRDVKFTIRCLAWKEGASGGGNRPFLGRRIEFTFSSSAVELGWVKFLSSSQLEQAGLKLQDFLSPEGYLILQAEVDPRTALEGPNPVGAAAP